MSVELTEEIAGRFARIALGHVAREYPNKLDHVMAADEDAHTPRDLHPAFFGSFDWHSCVHSWWLLLTLRRLFPEMAEARMIDELAQATLTSEKLAAELAYARRPDSSGFERPYGWAWLLALHQEAELHVDREWGECLRTLAEFFAESFSKYLKVLTYPISVGTHYNTAFSLHLAQLWARERDEQFLKLIIRYSNEAYGNKTEYSGWEPGGDEFLSPVLSAALLMAEIAPRNEFTPWFDALVMANGWLERECLPVTVSDRSDGKIAHLDGLNLSRAWCLWGIERALGEAAPNLLGERAQLHFDAAQSHVAGDYMGEHWLATFALLALLERKKSAPA